MLDSRRVRERLSRIGVDVGIQRSARNSNVRKPIVDQVARRISIYVDEDARCGKALRAV